MEPRNDPWDAALPAENGLTDDVNPYEFHRDRPAASLRITLRSAGKFVFKNDDVVQAGVYLGRLQESCMMRRTYASVINEHTIGADLSALIRRQIDMSYDTEQQEGYQDAPADHIRRLATILEDGMLVWNQKHYRVLVLLSHWLGFRLAAYHVYASTIVYWKRQG
jgi:hypothetical protein